MTIGANHDGKLQPRRLLPMSRWRWMARPCEEPDLASRPLPICWPSVPIRVRKRSGKCASTRKPTRIPVAKQVLPVLPIWQRVCTADALHTHAEFLRLMHTLGAETVLTVKGNQPTLYED